MKHLTKESISDLLQAPKRAPAITIYMPTHRAPSPPNINENQIRFKNLMNQAIELLKNRDEAHDFIQFMESTYHDIEGNKSFWEERTEGLLICIRPGEVQTYNLPIECDEYVAVDDHFHLTPIYAFLANEMEFYVLALAQRDPALYKGDMYELKPAKVALPESPEEALNIDEPHQKSIQFHSGAGRNGGPAMYHGHGGGKDAGSTERNRFFRVIDDVVCSLSDISWPLILAGTESEVVEYKSISNYPHITDAFVSGNYTGVHPNELHKHVLPIIEQEIISSEHEQVLERFAQLSGENNTMVATDYAAIKDAAEKGRIETLAVGMSRRTRDTVSDRDEEVTKITFGRALNQKALDYIARLVWSQSGKIINLEQGQMPLNAPMFAIMRY